jgi:hypothetical protein
MLDAARNIANAVLGEGLRRLDLMREAQAYQAARKMSRGEPRSRARKARATEFKRLFEAFGFTGHGLQKFAQACRDNCWIKDHSPGHVAHGNDLAAAQREFESHDSQGIPAYGSTGRRASANPRRLSNLRVAARKSPPHLSSGWHRSI